MSFPLVLVLGAAWLGAAQPASPAKTCSDLLTPDEVKAAAIVGLEEPGEPAENTYPSGASECMWQGNDVTVSFQFASLAVLKAENEAPEYRFRMDVEAVEADGRKREAIPGVGLDAALVPLEGEASLVEVRRADGVVRMILYRVPKPAALALAKAVATP